MISILLSPRISFNSLFGIRPYTKIAYSYGVSAFNSLFGIQEQEKSKSEPAVTFNSLFGILLPDQMLQRRVVDLSTPFSGFLCILVGFASEP